MPKECKEKLPSFDTPSKLIKQKYLQLKVYIIYLFCTIWFLYYSFVEHFSTLYWVPAIRVKSFPIWHGWKRKWKIDSYELWWVGHVLHLKDAFIRDALTTHIVQGKQFTGHNYITVGAEFYFSWELLSLHISNHILLLNSETKSQKHQIYSYWKVYKSSLRHQYLTTLFFG